MTTSSKPRKNKRFPSPYKPGKRGKSEVFAGQVTEVSKLVFRKGAPVGFKKPYHLSWDQIGARYRYVFARISFQGDDGNIYWFETAKSILPTGTEWVQNKFFCIQSGQFGSDADIEHRTSFFVSRGDYVQVGGYAGKTSAKYGNRLTYARLIRTGEYTQLTAKEAAEIIEADDNGEGLPLHLRKKIAAIAELGLGSIFT